MNTAGSVAPMTGHSVLHRKLLGKEVWEGSAQRPCPCRAGCVPVSLVCGAGVLIGRCECKSLKGEWTEVRAWWS